MKSYLKKKTVKIGVTAVFILNPLISIPLLIIEVYNKKNMPHIFWLCLWGCFPYIIFQLEISIVTSIIIFYIKICLLTNVLIFKIRLYSIC